MPKSKRFKPRSAVIAFALIALIWLISTLLSGRSSVQRQVFDPLGLALPETLRVVNRSKRNGLDPIWMYELSGPNDAVAGFAKGLDAAVTAKGFERATLQSVQGTMVPLPNWWPPTAQVGAMTVMVYLVDRRGCCVLLIDMPRGRIFVARIDY